MMRIFGYTARGRFDVYEYFSYTSCDVEVVSASGSVYLD